MITKENFENNTQVRQLAIKIVEVHKGKIFLDLDDQKVKRFTFASGQLSFEV